MVAASSVYHAHPISLSMGQSSMFSVSLRAVLETWRRMSGLAQLSNSQAGDIQYYGATWTARKV